MKKEKQTYIYLKMCEYLRSYCVNKKCDKCEHLREKELIGCNIPRLGKSFYCHNCNRNCLHNPNW